MVILAGRASHPAEIHPTDPSLGGGLHLTPGKDVDGRLFLDDLFQSVVSVKGMITLKAFPTEGSMKTPA